MDTARAGWDGQTYGCQSSGGLYELEEVSGVPTITCNTRPRVTGPDALRHR